jgi:hypothetical protein
MLNRRQLLRRGSLLAVPAFLGARVASASARNVSPPGFTPPGLTPLPARPVPIPPLSRRPPSPFRPPDLPSVAEYVNQVMDDTAVGGRD